MEIIALAFGLIAFLLALKLRGELTLLRERLERLDSAGSGSGSRAERELAEGIETNRAFLARLAAGESLDPEQIREGRLWGDVAQARALELLGAGVRVLDVRTPQETLAGVLPGALRIPVDELPTRFGELGRKSTPTLVYCAMGVRSAAACQFLSEQGFATLHNLEAGFTGWSGPTEVPEG
jgi:rhodanese-related sulfurtransferase